jgi:hypothetical protein
LYLHQRILKVCQTLKLRWYHRVYAITDQPVAWIAIYSHFLWIICMPLCPALLFYNVDFGLSWVYLYGVWVDHRWLPMLDTWAIPTVKLGLLEFWVLVYIVVAIGDVDLASSFGAKHPVTARPYSRNITIRFCVVLCLLLQTLWYIASWRIARWPSVVGGIGTFWWVLTQTWLVWRYGFSSTIYREHAANNATTHKITQHDTTTTITESLKYD